MKLTRMKKKIDWSKVVEIVIAILTLGLTHIRKHQPSQKGFDVKERP